MEKRIEFSANSLLKLLTHYYQDHDAGIPLDAELVSAGVSPYIQRWVMLEVKSEEWLRNGVPIDPRTGEPEFLHVRYEGGKTASWQQEKDGAPKMQWKESVEAPT